MDKEQTLEGNKTIAEFMGATPCELMVKSIGIMAAYECEEWKLPIDEIEYHKSWDWLMPVVEKIEGLKITIGDEEIKYFEFTIKNKFCLIIGHSTIKQPGCYYQTPYGFVPESKIDATWLAIVEFIRWYN